MRFVFLGTGTSHGIPVIACPCQVCRSDDPRDKRTRSSVLVMGEQGERLLVDIGPEFRLQALAADIRALDAVLLTHSHADHLHGLDDLRPLCRKKPIAVYGNKATIAELVERFAYIFYETQRGGGKPKIEPKLVSPTLGPESALHFGGISALPIPIKHGRLDILGWLFQEGEKRAAYLTDISALPEESAKGLVDLDLLVLGALRVRPHETHLNFDQAIELARRLKPKRALLTHICHEHSHVEIEAYCGDERRIGPAYDTLIVGI